ncbi:MAG TPA: TonB-dependent receptor plug domain-containing protein, partial [Puia sp.]
MRVSSKENFQVAFSRIARLKKFLPVGSLAILAIAFSLPGYAQNTIHVTGNIKNESGQPVSGASVLVKGLRTGVTSQENGHFEIDAPTKGTLVVSYVGMVTQELNVGASPITVTLVSLETGLNQVVVVGYGSQKKSDITGSVVNVSSRTLQETPTANIISELKGRAAGVDIVSNSSYPGSSGQIRIRGNRSLVQEITGNPSATAANNDALNGPLLVVDGIPYGGSVNDLNPDDISGIDILKDASATAIYGSRGSNGVLIITTNRGKSGKAVMSYNGYFGLTNALGEYKG